MMMRMCVLLAVFAIGVQGQVPSLGSSQSLNAGPAALANNQPQPNNPGSGTPNVLPGPNNPMMPGMTSNQLGQMIPNQRNMMSNQGNMMPNLFSVATAAGMGPGHMGGRANQLYPHGNNMFSSHHMSGNQAYDNQQQGNQGMGMLPILGLLGGDKMQQYATMNMLMGNQGQSKSMIPFMFMDGMGEMLPFMLPFTNSRGNAQNQNQNQNQNPLMWLAYKGMM